MLYAHSLPDQPPEKWQSLSEHLLAVAELAAQMADVFHASLLAFIIGYLHDLGKASEEGQKRIHGTGPRVDHSTAGARELIERWERQYGERCKVLAECLSYCITGHHSGLADYGEHDLDTGTLRNRLSNKRSIPDYKTGMQELRVPELEPRPVPFRVNGFSLAFFIRMLFSCLTDADWLDTEAFCNPERADKRKKDWPDIETLATRLMQTFCQREWLGKKEDRTVWPSDSVNEISRAQGIIRARKAILARSIEAAEQSPGLFSLTVPTGGGKTASSMAFALEHARRHGLRRVILVVPYTSIIEQNARELREWLGDDAVLEHHSQYIHPAERRQENKGGQTDDDQPDALQAQQFRMATENWDATVIVTTAVQFFESLFAASPQRCRKLHNIARSVIIFDEAQMIPVSLLKPSVLAMKELAFHYGCSLLFCTATQPALNRDGQNDEFPGFEPSSVTEIIPAERLLSLFSLFSRVKRTQLGKISDTELAKNLKSEKQVLCIVNTRARAQEVFEACCGPDDTDSWFHLSARMTPAHRIQVLEKCIRERLRKEQTCHVVSTSLIECGVDISFPALYREQSGLDSVAQAAGRCNRHGELPEGGRFYVFKPECGLPKRAHDLQRRATLFDSVICQYDDPFTPEAVASYFSQLRSYANTDESDVLRTLCDGNTGTAQGYRFNFRSADRAYRFIDTDMIPVIVENDIERSDAAELVRKLERYEDDPLLFRRLQQHTVQIYPWEVETLERHGALECIRERFYVLRNGTGYDRQLGLVVNDPTHMDAEKGIF